MKKVRWGILSTAKIGVTKVIPALQAGAFGEVVAIASRNAAKGEAAARKLGIGRSYSRYEELLADPEIDAIFNPLPNHLHLEWSLKTINAGKHLLCEKPLALNATEALKIAHAARSRPELKVMEAFMYRFHPQWQFARQQVDAGTIGPIQAIQSFFSYFNNDPGNIRNQPNAGGGALLDIGCYCISLSRFLFNKEPDRVSGIMHLDPQFKTDTLLSGALDFSGCFATFTCSTQSMPYQRVNVVGTKGRIEIEIPFNAPLDKPCRILMHDNDGSIEKAFPICNQYIEQGNRFCEAILSNQPSPTPIEDAVNNMKVIDAFRRSAETGVWCSP